LNIFLFSLIALQLISCVGDRRYSLSSDFDFVSRNNLKKQELKRIKRGIIKTKLKQIKTN
jgi:hypothetical protein